MSRTRARRAARAGATTAVALAAAVGAIQALQSVVGDVDWRSEAWWLLIGTVGFGTLAFERLRVRRDLRRRLRDAARTWPFPTMPETDPYALGVFPATRAERAGALGPYVPREVDAPLRKAIAESDLVLIFGPARAGKSRAAFEAARRVLVDAAVLIPKNRDGLAELLALESPRRSEVAHFILWLDGLERFVEELDAETLDELAARDPRITIVATVRTQDWEAMLAESGETAEAAKAVAARARAFEVPAALERSRHAEAARAYPGLNVSDGIGVALSTSGKESGTPVRATPLPPNSVDDRVRDPARRDRVLLSFGIAAGLFLIGLLTVGFTSGFEEPEVRSQAEQADAVKQRETRGGRRTVLSKRVDFHGSGHPSYLFIFAPQDAGSESRGSYEIQIHDLEGKRLERRFRYEPRTPGAVFETRHLGDLDGNGSAELIGGYSVPGASARVLLPLVIYWDDDAAAYNMVSLQRTPPPLDERVPRILGDRYTTPFTVGDTEDKTRVLHGYAVYDFDMVRKPAGLVGAVEIEPPSPTKPRVFQVMGMIYKASGAQPETLPCRLENAKALILRYKQRVDLPTALVSAWRRGTRGRACASG